MANEASIYRAIVASSPAPFPAMNMIGVIRKSIELLFKNEFLILQVYLLVLFPLSLLVFLHYLVAGPLIIEVEDSYERSSLDPKDIRALVALELPFFVLFCVVSLFGTTITILASAKTYSATKSVNLKELLSRMLSNWKKPIITWLCVSILMIVYATLSIISTQLMALIGVCKWVIGASAVLIYPYLASVSTLGLVISIVDDDCRGIKAIAKARKLIGERKFDGYFLMTILVVMSIPVNILFYVTTSDDDDELGCVTRFSFMFVATVLFCVTNLYTFVVYTVFYFECKQIESHGEKTEMDMEGFCLVPAMVSADN